MSNYSMKDARFTAIYRREFRSGKGKAKQEVFILEPFELVRYNVDDTGASDQVIVPVGQPQKTGFGGLINNKAEEKVYEKIWVVEVSPFHVGRGGKHDFGQASDEGGNTRQGD